MTTTKQMTLEHAWRLGFIESAKWNGVCTQDADSLAAITAMKMDLGNAHLAKGAQDARKAFAFDALVAAGIVTQAKADESLAIADQAMLSQRGEVES